MSGSKGSAYLPTFIYVWKSKRKKYNSNPVASRKEIVRLAVFFLSKRNRASSMSEQLLARGVSPALLLLLAGGVAGEWTGHLGLSFESDRKVEERTMLCPSGFITGLKVRQGRDERSDIDTYDFQLQCGRRWSAWTGMTFTGLRQEKAFECPMKMHMTGLEVTKGRREWGDVDTYDFKLQCSGVWQEYMGLGVSSAKERAAKECPSGTMAWGWKAFRGFVKRGDQDYYNFDLNCKPAADSQQAVRKTPSPREIGLSPNVFLWSAKDVGTWLGVLGLGDYSAAFEARGTGWAGGWDGDGGEVRSLRPPRRRTSCRATSFSCCSSRTCRTSACARLATGAAPLREGEARPDPLGPARARSPPQALLHGGADAAARLDQRVGKGAGHAAQLDAQTAQPAQGRAAGRGARLPRPRASLRLATPRRFARSASRGGRFARSSRGPSRR